MELMDEKQFRKMLGQKTLFTDEQRARLSDAEYYDQLIEFFYSAGAYSERSRARVKESALHLLWYVAYFGLGFGAAGGFEKLLN